MQDEARNKRGDRKYRERGGGDDKYCDLYCFTVATVEFSFEDSDSGSLVSLPGFYMYAIVSF